jgi:hypothetical protein
MASVYGEKLTQRRAAATGKSISSPSTSSDRTGGGFVDVDVDDDGDEGKKLVGVYLNSSSTSSSKASYSVGGGDRFSKVSEELLPLWAKVCHMPLPFCSGIVRQSFGGCVFT